jgi:hypothetical protein
MSPMVKYGVLFEVRAESLNAIQTSFGFKGLITSFIDVYFLVHCKESTGVAKILLK